MERREALAAYNDAYKEQDDLYRAVARQCGLSTAPSGCCTPCGSPAAP